MALTSDNTVLLDGTQSSLQADLNNIETYGSYSGLRMNKDKTKVVWIGKKRNSKDHLNTVPTFSWGDTGFNLLGLDFDINLDKMTETNYEKYLKQIDLKNIKDT